MTNELPSSDWTFLSNHSHVLYCVSFWPDIRIREIALKVRITERAVQRIVVDLERGGYLKRTRVGRQNQYRLEPGRHLRHPLEHHVKVGRLLSVLQPGTEACEAAAQSSEEPAAVTERRLSAPNGRAAAARGEIKTISRLKKMPGKPLAKKAN